MQLRLTLTVVFSSLLLANVCLADVSLGIRAPAAPPGTTSLVSVFATTDADDSISGFNIPLEFGGNGSGLPPDFTLNAEPLQNVIFPNFNLNVLQNDIWDFDGVANADGTEVPLSSDVANPTKLFDLAIDVAPTAQIGMQWSVEVVEMLLLSISPSSLSRPIQAFTQFTVDGGIETIPGDCNQDCLLYTSPSPRD